MKVIVVAVLLGIASYAISRGLARASKLRAATIRSFAGGVSLAFVMLDLFVELAEGATMGNIHDVVRAGPEPVHTVAILLLVGTLGTFILAAYVVQHGGERRHLVTFAPHIGYVLLVGGALVEQSHEGPLVLGLFWIAMAIHLGVVDRCFGERFSAEHGPRSTATSSVAVVVGAIAWTVIVPTVAVFHIILALVAGATLLLAFRDELPSPKESRIGAMVSGAAVFTLLEQLRWWL